MTERTWVFGAAGDWLDAGNWLPSGIPAPGDFLTVEGGSPVIVSTTITAEWITLSGGPITLDLTDVVFEPGLAGPLRLAVQGGDPEEPADVTLLCHGVNEFTGQLSIEAPGGGTLVISVASGGDFILEKESLLLVAQESRLIVAGDTFSNLGLVHVEGRMDINTGVDFAGPGTVEIDRGGQVLVKGSVASTQTFVFADGTGDLTISDPAAFAAKVGFTQYGGDQIHLDGIVARSVTLDGGELSFFRGRNGTGRMVAEIPVTLVNPADLEPVKPALQTLEAGDFVLSRDGDGGTTLTYAPHGPTYLTASLPVPVVAETGDRVSLASMFEKAFGTRHPGFYGITLLPATSPTGSSAFWGQPNVNGIDPVTSAWIVNGQAIDEAYTVKPGDKVAFLAGNSISFPPQLQAQMTPQAKGERAEYLTYSLWAVDPAVTSLINASGHPTPHDIVESARAFQAVYGHVLNTELCNWIADNVAAAAGATMPLPDADLDPAENVSGGFWKVVYRGSATDHPVGDWNTLVKPGDVVRLEWAGSGTGHTTTVLHVQKNGELVVYDNIDFIGKTETIGAHGDVAYWKKTDPAGITIYRLNPDHQYQVGGTALSELVQGSVFNDRITARAGNDIVDAATGRDQIWGGKGADVLSGGAGADVFEYDSLAESTYERFGRDTIVDFRRGSDKIDLSAANQRLTAEGKPLLHFTDPQHAYEPGAILFERRGDDLLVKADTNWDGRFEFAIKVLDLSTLGPGDFIL